MKVIAYPSYVIAEWYRKAVLKVDIHTGQLLSELKSGTIGSVWELDPPYILVNKIRGKLSIVNTETMSVVKSYKESTINPNKCLSLLIQECQLRENGLWICGIENHPNRDYNIKNPTPYTRLIDENFKKSL